MLTELAIFQVASVLHTQTSVLILRLKCRLIRFVSGPYSKTQVDKTLCVCARARARACARL